MFEGVDASAFAAHYASTRYGVDVACATLEEARFPDGVFDVVIQKDLLEHVADPRSHLEETRRLLRPGGWLRLVTPNGEANLRPLAAASRSGRGPRRRCSTRGTCRFLAVNTCVDCSRNVVSAATACG